MRTEVFSTQPVSLKRPSYKDLRADDYSGQAHCLLIRNASTIELVRHELNNLVIKHPDKVFKLNHSDLLKYIVVRCDNKIVYQGSYKDVEQFYQLSCKEFFRYISSKMR